MNTNETLELAAPIEAGQTYRWTTLDHPAHVDIKSLTIDEDGNTQLRIDERTVDTTNTLTVDAEGFFERVADGRLELVEEDN